MAGAVVGRDEEFSGIRDLIERAATGHGGVRLLHGPAGIGKSALLSAAAAFAAEAGAVVLTGSGAVSEQTFGFALLDQILRPVVARVPEGAVLDGLLRRSGDPAPVYAVAQATLDLVTALADGSPVVVIVDDLHWADAPSAVALSFAARRVAADPVVFLGAYRDDAGHALALDAGLPGIALSPLSPVSAERLLRLRMPGLGPLARRRVLREAEGNPLALLELAQAADDGLPDGGAGLPVSERLHRMFAARIAGLPGPVRTALLVAALGDGARDRVLAAAREVTGQPLGEAELRAAADARIIEPILDGVVRFRHPLLAHVLRRTADPGVRRECHRALADVTGDQPRRRVWHLAAAAGGPDERIAADLTAAAGIERERGAGVTAHRMFLRAAELSAVPEGRQRRLMAALVTAADLGDVAEVRRLAAVVEPARLDAPTQLSLALLRESYLGDGPGTDPSPDLAALAAALPAGGDYAELLAGIGEIATRLYWVGAEGAPLRATLLAVADRLPVPADDPRRLHVDAMLAPAERGRSVLDRLRRRDLSGAGPISLYQVGLAAQVSGDLLLSRRLQAAAITALRASAQLTPLVNTLASQSVGALLLGDARLAAACAEETGRLAPDIGQPLSGPVGQILLAASAGLRGDAGTAAELIAEAEQVLVPLGFTQMLILVRMARAFTALGQNRPEEAFAELLPIFEAGSPTYHPGFRLFLLQPLAEAAVRAGRQDDLRRVLATLPADAGSTGGPWVRAGLRYAGAVLAGTDDGDGERQLVAALAEGDLAPVARAHLQLAYGQWLRRRRRAVESRVPLRAALRAFEALGLLPWAETAREQLRAAGERVDTTGPASIDRLTPQELYIATLAAQGMTNRDIAQRLYVSPRTIGSHLYRIFPKLGVTSRADLSTALGEV